MRIYPRFEDAGKGEECLAIEVTNVNGTLVWITKGRNCYSNMHFVCELAP